MTNSGKDNRQQGTKNYSMTVWLGTRVCFIDLTWSKRPGRRPLRFSKPGTIISPLNFQIMLRAPGDRKQPCAFSNAISINGFPRTGYSGIGPKSSWLVNEPGVRSGAAAALGQDLLDLADALDLKNLGGGRTIQEATEWPAGI